MVIGALAELGRDTWSLNEWGIEHLLEEAFGGWFDPNPNPGEPDLTYSAALEGASREHVLAALPPLDEEARA